MQFTSPLRITTGANLEELMRVNVTAAFALARAFRQKGVSSPGSSLVFLSSVMGIVGQSGQTAYSASKGALISLTKSLALELSRENIRVNCVAPALVRTEMSNKMLQALTPDQVTQIEAMHPLGIGAPRDVANAIAFLLADTGRWITGTTLVVDGGYTAH
jgi:NAD(P)-dependent dehydrogenase (short-subunit alcohol dehydrogenase family)